MALSALGAFFLPRLGPVNLTSTSNNEIVPVQNALLLAV